MFNKIAQIWMLYEKHIKYLSRPSISITFLPHIIIIIIIIIVVIINKQ
jgi:hypothetical protein